MKIRTGKRGLTEKSGRTYFAKMAYFSNSLYQHYTANGSFAPGVSLVGIRKIWRCSYGKWVGFAYFV